MNGIDFVKAGKFRVSLVHIASVQFNDDGSAVIHTISNNVTVVDPAEVSALRELVGDQPAAIPATDAPVAAPATDEQGAPAQE